MFCASRALDGLGSPPLLLLGDVILQKTALSIKRWQKMCHNERGHAADTHDLCVPCICCLLQSDASLCTHPSPHVKLNWWALKPFSYCIPHPFPFRSPMTSQSPNYKCPAQILAHRPKETQVNLLPVITHQSQSQTPIFFSPVFFHSQHQFYTQSTHYSLLPYY